MLSRALSGLTWIMTRTLARRMGGAKRYPSIAACAGDGFRERLNPSHSTHWASIPIIHGKRPVVIARSGATKQSTLSLPHHGLLRFARYDGIVNAQVSRRLRRCRPGLEPGPITTNVDVARRWSGSFGYNRHRRL